MGIIMILSHLMTYCKARVKDYEMLTSCSYKTSESIGGRRWSDTIVKKGRKIQHWLIDLFLSCNNAHNQCWSNNTVEADQKFNIFAVQLWCKGLIQKWTLWLAHKSWGSVFKELLLLPASCVAGPQGIQASLWLAWHYMWPVRMKILKDLVSYCRINSTEGSRSCRACLVVSELGEAKQCGLWIIESVRGSGPCAFMSSEMRRRYISSRWCLFSTRFAHHCAAPAQRVAQLGHIFGVAWPKEAIACYKGFTGYFFACACLIHILRYMRDWALHWWEKGPWTPHSSSALLARLWRCGARGWLCVCSVPMELLLWRDSVLVAQPCTAVCGCTSAPRPCIIWREEFEIYDPLCVLGTFPACRSNSSSPLYMHGVLGCLERHYLCVTLPAWDLTSCPFRERFGSSEIQETKLNSHCLWATIKLLSNAHARTSLYADQRLSFWGGKQANKPWPCQWLERGRKVLWSSLISPCWCLTATAAWLCVCVLGALLPAAGLQDFPSIARERIIFSVFMLMKLELSLLLLMRFS